MGKPPESWPRLEYTERLSGIPRAPVTTLLAHYPGQSSPTDCAEEPKNPDLPGSPITGGSPGPTTPSHEDLREPGGRA